MQEMNFVFTKTDFCLDVDASEEERARIGEDKFAALYQMGFEEKNPNATATGAFLYLLASFFFDEATNMPEIELVRERLCVKPSEAAAERLIDAAPFAIGAEFITKEWICGIFDRLTAVFASEIANYDGSVAMYFAEKTQRLRTPERVFFHLIEQKDENFPFAFLATYATQEGGKVRHMPLKYALSEFREDRDRLLALLSCLNRASEASDLIAGFVESGEMFHPLRLTADEAYIFLKDVEAIEAAGILCRIPNWWRKKSSSPTLSVGMGGEKQNPLGLDTIVSIVPHFTVNGEELTEEEIRELLAQSEGLALLKGKWVEVNHEKLRELLSRAENLPEALTLAQLMRSEIGEEKISLDGELKVTNSSWLSEILLKMRKRETPQMPEEFTAKLRPYQENGYAWLCTMSDCGFGACLADDMGLGKTVQVLAYLEHMREERQEARTLLIVPASLLGNWQKEIEKFAPKMDYLLLHGKTAPKLEEDLAKSEAFLTITTYSMAARIKSLAQRKWTCVILDEAQAIKNPAAKQTREIKKIGAMSRIAMTGTPIENDLVNLWSLFDFLNKGMLGTSKEFQGYKKRLGEAPSDYAKLRKMISPFMLRRLKTDKTIINDLPDKIESVEYVSMSKKQVVLYRKAVADVEARMKEKSFEGMERRGVILAAITKLKQICNHPDQYLGQSGFEESESGKLQTLREICETIFEKRERVIVFTQFREMTQALSDFLSGVFGIEGCVLHGGTPVKKREKIVEKFQGEEYVPYIVVSLKAGGTGLNLTKANHVVHFDRWWNPAVENQATDRAFRIGQTKETIVHKLVCKGTIEEKIDEIITSKTRLAENVIASGGEAWITEMSNDEILSALRLE
ncbi:MAG: DEAD/DEAH box helicase [Clostridia bacterium]|nr:DEAD/DEAH box helicase [Clostridia bacterium]